MSLAAARENLSIHAIHNHHRGRVLVAEDYAISQNMIVNMLTKMGVEVDVAADGLEALEYYQSRQYDVIFMDCMMPEIDGYCVTQIIRENEPEGIHVPIVAVTANAMNGDRKRCLDAGMDAYMAKPLRAKDLDDMLYRYLPYY